MSHHRSQNALRRQWCRSRCRLHYLQENASRKDDLKMEMKTKQWSWATPSCWTSAVSNKNTQMCPWCLQEKKLPNHSKVQMHHTRKWRSSHLLLLFGWSLFKGDDSQEKLSGRVVLWLDKQHFALCLDDRRCAVKTLSCTFIAYDNISKFH